MPKLVITLKRAHEARRASERVHGHLRVKQKTNKKERHREAEDKKQIRKRRAGRDGGSETHGRAGTTQSARGNAPCSLLAS